MVELDFLWFFVRKRKKKNDRRKIKFKQLGNFN